MLNQAVGVTVVIPVYNKRAFLPRALHCVLAQSYKDFEVILVDDGSTDGSLESVSDVHDPRVRRVRQVNQGVSAARNAGIKLARGPLVAFLDADDSWDREFLRAMVELSRRFPSAGLYASNYRIQQPNEPAKPARIRGLPRIKRKFQSSDYFRFSTGGELPVSASSVCIPRRVLDEVGGFPLGERMGEDQHLWWRICVRYPLAFDKRYLATYHRDAEDRTCPANVPGEELPFSRKLQEELTSLGLPMRQHWHARRYIGAHLLYLVRENAKVGKQGVAVQLLKDRRTRLLPLKYLWRKLQLAAMTLNPAS